MSMARRQLWHIAMAALTSCSTPKDLYFPSGGGAGGKRLRSSGGRDKRSRPEPGVGSGPDVG